MFGMGTGGSLRLLSPEIVCSRSRWLFSFAASLRSPFALLALRLASLFGLLAYLSASSTDHTLKTAQGDDLTKH